MPTILSCPTCQKVLKSSNPIPAGKLVKCPGCKNVFPAPGDSEEGIQAKVPAPAGKRLPQNKKNRDLDEEDEAPRSRKDRGDEEEVGPRRKKKSRVDDEDEDLPPRKRKKRRDEDEEEEDDDDRPRSAKSRRKAGKSGKKLFIALGVGGLGLLLMVLALTGFVWPGFLLSGPELGNDPLLFLPGDCNLVFGANMGAFRNNPDFKNGLDKALAMNPNMLPGQKEIFQEAESVLAAGKTGQNFEGAVVVLTSKPQDVEKVRKAFQAGAEEKLQGRSIYRSKDGILILPNPQMIVLAKMPDPQVSKLLENKSPVLRAELLSQVTNLRRNTAWVVFSLDGEPRQKLQQLKPKDMQVPLLPGGPGLDDLLPVLQQAKTVNFLMDTGPDAKNLKLEVGLQCANDGDAKKGETSLSAFWEKTGKGLLAGAPLMIPMKGPEAQGLQGLIQDISNTFKIQAAGSNLMASLTLSENTMKGLEKGAGNLPLMLGGMPGVPIPQKQIPKKRLPGAPR